MLIRVKVFPNSRKQEVVRKSDDSFVIKIKEKAEKGRANQKVLEILSNSFKIEKQKIKLTRGAKKRNKVFVIKEERDG